MKNNYLLLFVLFISCTSPQKLVTYKYVPNNGKNLLKNLEATITEKEKFYVFETKDYSLNFQYNWRSYLEPTAKEQVRHSPFKNSKIDSEIYLSLRMKNTKTPKRDLKNSMLKTVNNLKFFYKKPSSVIRSEGKEKIGDFIRRTFYFTRNDKRFQKSTTYYLFENKFLSFIVVYPVNISEKKLSEINTIKKSLVLKDSH